MRILVIRSFFLFFFFCLLVRLFYWQVVKAEFLEAQADNQHFATDKIEANRGRIFFSDRSLLASSNPSFSLYGLPKAIPEKEKVNTSYLIARVFSEDLAEVDTKAKEIINKLSQDLYWVLLKKNIPLEKK